MVSGAKKSRKFSNWQKTLQEKEKFLIVFKRILQQTRKNQTLFGKGLKDLFYKFVTTPG